LTKDGKPFAPIRFEQIVKEQYLISKSINTSVVDLDKITPRERELFLKFISEDRQEEKRLMEEMRKKK
jgi:hypothetical protein